ncbi:VCBS repeat-containing protein [Streptomyces sp. YIM 98790]|uniref:VCBS repeat-containing protein n=1 Tax=Streptomyces sp. YIM 98790 TaxID=2689077 RepID=UPI00140D587D|nr:VCBS repeat-containing protein [Streptomyces sp. YIM 98790]
MTATAVAVAGLGLWGLTGADESGRAKTGTGTEDDNGALPEGPWDESEAQQVARARGERVEATELRDAYSTTWALPDGSFEYEAHVAPVRALVDGEWREIDTALEPDGEGGWSPAAVTRPMVFSGGTASGTAASGRADRAGARPAEFTRDESTAEGREWSELVTFTVDGRQMTLSWPGVLPQPVIEGPRALYQEVLPGVDLLLTARDSGFSNVLIVKTRQPAADGVVEQVRYRLTSPDLTFTLDPVTGVVSAKDASGKEVAVSPSPYMWDSAGKPAMTQGDDPQPDPPQEEPVPEADESIDPPEEPEDTIDDSYVPNPLDEDRADRGRSPRAAPTAADAGQMLELPGLAGPQPGTHDAVAGISLAADGTLTLSPDTGLLADDRTQFPVFIDPSFTAGTNNWTTVYAKHKSTSFWNGQNFNDGTNSARVGYESTTGGLSRSLFQLQWDRKLRGAHISSAYFYAKETYAWSCSPRSVELWRTGPISSTTTWYSQPDWHDVVDSKNVAHGYSSSCPDEFVKFTATSLAQTAADSGWSLITVGLQATNEADDHAWKKFTANGSDAPRLKATYNRKPNEPTKLKMSGGHGCDTGGQISIGKQGTINFAATSSDLDHNLKYLHFQLWREGWSDIKILDRKVTVDSTGHAWTGVSTTATEEQPHPLRNGVRYWWRVRAIDSTGAASTYAPPGSDNCGFVYDSTAPSSPFVSSTDFPAESPDNEWSLKKFGESGVITFAPGDENDGVVRYDYSFNGHAYNKEATPGTDGTAEITDFRPPHAGPNVVYVRAVDTAGNVSAGTPYVFYVRPRNTPDAPGDTGGDGYPDMFVINPDGSLRSLPGDDAGDLHRSIGGAHDSGDPPPAGYWKDAAGNPALITHNGDFLPGDGIADVLARMPVPDDRLYLYPGDGYGSVDISRRIEVLLPPNAPDPAALTEIKAAGDITGDGRPDMFAIAEDQLWALTGYTGGAFDRAVLLLNGAWGNRDIVNVTDISGDGIADLLYRNRSNGELLLRLGKPGADGTGVDLTSLGRAVDSATGTDAVYGTGWTATGHPMIMGIPDANGDSVPDIWTTVSDGSLRVYHATRTSAGSWTKIMNVNWDTKLALG